MINCLTLLFYFSRACQENVHPGREIFYVAPALAFVPILGPAVDNASNMDQFD